MRNSLRHEHISDGELASAGRSVVPHLQAEELPAPDRVLQQVIARHLPRVELTDLLVEVDGWTQFEFYLQPL